MGTGSPEDAAREVAPELRDLLQRLDSGPVPARLRAFEDLGEWAYAEDAVLPACLRLLAEDPEPTIRATAAQALGWRCRARGSGDAAIVDHLRRAVEADSAAEVRAAAALALADAAEAEDGVPMLDQALADPDPAVRAAAARALAGFWPYVVNDGRWEWVDLRDQDWANLTPAVALALKAMGDPDRIVALAAARALSGVPYESEYETPPPAFAAHAFLLEFGDDRDRSDAMDRVVGWGGGAYPMLDALKRILTDPEWRPRRVWIVKRLADIGRNRHAEADVAGALIPLLGDPSPDLRAAAISGLAEMGPPREAVEPILASLGDAEPSVRARAAAALRHSLESPRVTAALIRTLDDEDRLVGLEAASALSEGSAAADEVVRRLTAWLADRALTANDRGVTAHLLEQYGRAALPALPALRALAASADADDRLRGAAARAAANIGENEYGALVKALVADSWEARERAVRLLGVGGLTSALSEPDPKVRLAAADALGQCKPLPAESVRALVEVLLGDDQRSVTRWAYDALIQAAAADAVALLVDRLIGGTLTPDRRREAALWLGEFGAEGRAALPALRALAESPGGDVKLRSAAARAAARLSESARAEGGPRGGPADGAAAE